MTEAPGLEQLEQVATLLISHNCILIIFPAFQIALFHRNSCKTLLCISFPSLLWTHNFLIMWLQFSKEVSKKFKAAVTPHAKSEVDICFYLL